MLSGSSYFTRKGEGTIIMHRVCVILLAGVFYFTRGAVCLAATEPSIGPGGHWTGSITLPNASLGVRVDLRQTPGQVWEGTIDIPVQGLRGFKLNPVKVVGTNVSFGMPGIPGDPLFEGRLSKDAKVIEGDFTQG